NPMASTVSEVVARSRRASSPTRTSMRRLGAWPRVWWQARASVRGVRVGLEARRLLATTSDTVEAIGFRLGFSEATNFVKFFKRVVGITPEAFRLTQRFVT
ncbi:MAG: helix-turn-helix domain-containing protein, partial [Bacteroidota bacterium]